MMKVDLNALTAQQAAEQSVVDRARKNASSETTAAAASASTEDRSTFQPTFPPVATLAAQAQRMPEIRQDRVNALKQQIADGSYKLDSDTIVSALIANGGR